MTRVAVQDEVLRWALFRSQRPVPDLEDKFPRLWEWLTGETDPTLKQLERFARATRTPFGYLFLESPPDEELSIPHFRTQGDQTPESPSPDLLDTLHTMERRQAWMRDYLRDEGQEPLDYVGSASVDDSPMELASRIRESLGFDHQWAASHSTWTAALRALREEAESAGVLVTANGVVGNNTHRKLDPEEFRGFVLVDEYAPLIFINNADAKAAQMFTIAHELAHVFLGSSAAFDLRQLQPADNPTEKACNEIAAEFLVPASAIKDIWSKVKDRARPFDDIAHNFKVSSIVAARRALDLNLIDKNRFLEFWRDYQADERRRQRRGSGGGDFYNNQNLRVGKRFARTVIRAAREGKLLYSEAYNLTGLHGKTFDKYAERLGLGSSP